MDRRLFLAGSSAVACQALFGGATAKAERPPSPNEKTPDELVTPPTKRAIEKGLAYLARKQIKSGAGQGSFGTSGYAAGVAVTGLGGLAFMCGGSVPGDGPYGTNVDLAVNFLVKNTADTGYVSVNGGYDNMYGHGFATLFMSEAYGMTQNVELGNKLRKAIDLIVRCQNNQGGWRYMPQKSDADLSVTVCQIMALRAAHDAGINVPDETRKKCIDYVKNSFDKGDGGFRYTMQGGHTSFPLTAAGICSLYSAGIYESEQIKRGLEYLEKQQNGQGFGNGYYFYGHYYAVQAMWHAGGEHWNKWYPWIRAELLKGQQGDGSWADAQAGNEFGTAMACIILQMPLNHVPIYAP